MTKLTLSKNFSENDLYRLIARQLPRTTVAIIDHDLRFLLAEGTSLIPIKNQHGDLVGRTLYDLAPPELIPALEKLCREMLAGKTQEMDFQSSFTGRYYHLDTFPIEDENGQIV